MRKRSRFQDARLFALVAFCGGSWLSACGTASDSLGVAELADASADALADPKVPTSPSDGPDWACLDRVGVHPPAEGTIHRNLTFVDLLSQMPRAGVTVTVCSKLDPVCVFPISQFQSNSAGQIDVEINVGFDGYFQVEAAGIYPTLIFLPSSSEPTTSIILPLMPATFFPTMMSGAGITAVAEDRSTVMVTALDCLGRPAAGVSLSSPEADAQTVSYMVTGGMPSRTALVTDVSGAGGLVNIPAGVLLINATLAASGRLVGSVGVNARPGYVSMVLLKPNGS